MLHYEKFQLYLRLGLKLKNKINNYNGQSHMPSLINKKEYKQKNW